ncbi:MAG: response regulator [Candidatus Korobacteraceae bacterium]
MTLRVLIVDDSLTVRMDLKEAFENGGFEVTACSTLQAARAAFSNTAFAIVILDVLLPDGDGVEFLAELKSSEQTAHLPVMLLSTEARVQDRVRGLETGADEYVGKPYGSAYVLARARELIHRPGPGAGANGHPTVLVIDDSATFRNEIGAVLEAAGYNVNMAANGEDGLHLAVDHRPAAIIIDHTLPGINGTTVVRRMREDAALRRTPCLLLTASEDRATELEALEAGADSFVRKDEDFSVVLARLAAVLRSASTPSAFESQPGVLGPKKVLAVDDSLTYLDVLSGELRQEGYDVALARSGEEALELLAVQAVDCILLDIVMPGLSGNDTCRRIKDLPKLRDIPLLMLTSLEAREAMVESMNAGADDYIPKTSDFDVIRARVRAALRRKQFEDEKRGVREQLLRKELEIAEARAQRELAETRAALLSELREIETRADIAAEAADLGVWYWDIDTNEHAWSNRYRALFAMPPETQPSQQAFLDCLHPQDRVRTEQLLRDAVARRGEYENECRVAWPDGSMHWIVSKGRCISDESGKRLRMTGVAMDVTERKLTQEALVRTEKLASVGRMAATIAHEINNPLAAAMNAVFLAGTDKALSPAAQNNLHVAEQELGRVAHITKQTLGFYRETGNPVSVQLHEVIDGILDLFGPKLENKAVCLERRYRSTPSVYAIEGELRQVLSNLVANSIDALAQQGTLHIRTSGPVRLAQRAMVRITIADTGSGISPEHMKRIFEPFFTTKQAIGTGLGLWVTKELVQKHEGRIRVRSRVGRGTVFSIWLPAERRSRQREGPP